MKRKSRITTVMMINIPNIDFVARNQIVVKGAMKGIEVLSNIVISNINVIIN